VVILAVFLEGVDGVDDLIEEEGDILGDATHKLLPILLFA
jgi:hypothetical protein